MNIAIIGTGNVGTVLGRRFAGLGHDVVFGTRDPGSGSAQDLERGDRMRTARPREAASGAELVVLAVPGLAVESVVGGLGDLSGKVVVDCTNPIGKDGSLISGPSAAEKVAGLAPGARVVKAFNTTGAKNMENPVYSDGRLAMFICGNDAEAKATVTMLAEALGFYAIDNGPLKQARMLEAMAMVWINQAYGQGWGPDFGFAVLRR